MSPKHPVLLDWGGGLLSLWELSNVIKIHAGVLHILPVELSGRIANKQALPLLCWWRLWAHAWWAVRGNASSLSVLFECLITKPGHTDWSG